MSDGEDSGVTARIERGLERGIFWSRWLMAPFYVGLIAALAVLLVKFFEELIAMLGRFGELGGVETMLTILTLIDLSLAGNLVVMVVFAGFETFVSRIDTGASEDRPRWMGRIDFSELKLKLVASIVAISAIHLLKVFMNIKARPESEVMWLVIIHLTFVVSGVLLALMDKITENTRAAQNGPPGR